MCVRSFGFGLLWKEQQGSWAPRWVREQWYKRQCWGGEQCATGNSVGFVDKDYDGKKCVNKTISMSLWSCVHYLYNLNAHSKPYHHLITFDGYFQWLTESWNNMMVTNCFYSCTQSTKSQTKAKRFGMTEMKYSMLFIKSRTEKEFAAKRNTDW